VIDDLGNSPRQGPGHHITSVRSAIGKETGYMLRVERFESLGFGFADFPVHVHDLPEGIGIDGLLGLRFLKHFKPIVRSTALLPLASQSNESTRAAYAITAADCGSASAASASSSLAVYDEVQARITQRVRVRPRGK
jgi:hypothetical protein